MINSKQNDPIERVSTSKYLGTVVHENYDKTQEIFRVEARSPTEEIKAFAMSAYRRNVYR